MWRRRLHAVAEAISTGGVSLIIGKPEPVAPTDDRRERAIWEATAVLNEAMVRRAMKNRGEAETAPTTMELMRDCIAAYERVMDIREMGLATNQPRPEK